MLFTNEPTITFSVFLPVWLPSSLRREPVKKAGPVQGANGRSVKRNEWLCYGCKIGKMRRCAENVVRMRMPSNAVRTRKN